MSLIRTKEDYTKYINRISVIPYGLFGPTPDVLIETMVNQIDVDWKNPNLKILDPGFGFGGFLFFLYLKLKQYHSEEHILNNMLYGIEIEPFRFKLVQEKFKIKNLYNEDYINSSNKFKKILNMEFDVIIGNPPYQNTISGEHKSKKTLWAEFILKSHNILKPNGVLSFIVPDGWHSPTTDIPNNSISLFNDIFKNGNLIYCADSSLIKPHFKGVGQSFSMFIFVKNNSYKNTIFKSVNGEFEYDIKSLNFIPKNINKISFDIHKKVLNNTTDKFIFERYQKKDGGMIDDRHPHYNKPKLKFSRGLAKFKIDYDNGNSGYDVFTYACFLANNESVDSATSLMNSKLYYFILNQKWNQYFTKYIPNVIPKLPLNKIYSDSDLYKEFNLSNEEIDYIENHVK